MDAITAAVEQVFREEYGRVIAAVIAVVGDFELAEDALQDAFIDALTAWARAGIPARPAAWLTAAARRRAIDRLRLQSARKRGGGLAIVSLDAEAGLTEGGAPLAEAVADPTAIPAEEADMDNDDIPDDRLKLMFTCCHPALALESQVALTLRTLGGLTTDEIARAFVVSEATMAQRLTRARNKIRAAGIPYRIPPGDLLPERLDALLAVIYLVFNEGYAATAGDRLIRHDLCAEALRLARLLVDLLPADDPTSTEAHGLLALLLLHDARRASRVTPEGALILLDDQDRARWDRAQIAEGCAVLERALRLGRVGAYQLQAAIAALHAEAETPEATDWAQIAVLYDHLIEISPTPGAEISRIVAISRTDGVAAALRLLLHLGRQRPDMAAYLPYHAACADLLRRHGEREAALEAYTHALDLCRNGPQREFLRAQRDQLL